MSKYTKPSVECFGNPWKYLSFCAGKYIGRDYLNVKYVCTEKGNVIRKLRKQVAKEAWEFSIRMQKNKFDMLANSNNWFDFVYW